jgi:hypothetical protein
MVVTTSVNNFKALFNLVRSRHQGPVVVDFGMQMAWDGIVAGQCTKHIQFLEADGVSAVLDTKINLIRFNEGSADMLEKILCAQMQKLAPVAIHY